MFRLRKNKAAKSREKIGFKFSQFKALQVPKGWDKLFVSIISVETGKSIAKTSKALVRNGSCQWAEAFSESVWVSQDDSSKELEDCLFKLVVSMGSARSGILGEAAVNMKDYMNSSASVPVSFPLKKCSHETNIQVKIQCLSPRTKIGDKESKETNTHMEDLNEDCHDMDNKSEGTGSVLANSVESSSSKELGSPPLNPGEPGTTGTSFTSGSHHSYDSAEGSIGRENSSPRSNLSGDGHNLIGRQDSSISQNSVPHGNYPVDDPSQLNHSSVNSQVLGSGNHSENNPQELATSSLTIMDSKNLPEAAEDTIEELRMEAKMWKSNARQLMLDLDTLRQEFSDESKKKENLNMELSAACTERNSLEKEVEQLKLLLEKSMGKQTAMEDSTFQDEGSPCIQKELENEIKFQKEVNANLTLQLQRSQESNIELVSVLQELEETVEKQKLEMENLLSIKSKLSEMEKSIQGTVEENRNLMLQLQQLKDSEKKLQVKVQLLEQTLEEKNHEIENRERMSNQTLLNIEALKEKVQELERDCNELTDENLELLIKLKETMNKSVGGGSSFDFSAGVLLANSSTSSVTEVSDYLEEKMEKKVLRAVENNCQLSIQELESLKSELEAKVTEQGEELTDRRSEIAKLEANLVENEEEIGTLKQCKRELEAKVSVLQTEKIQLEENMEILRREGDITSKCLNRLQNDLLVLSSSVDSHVSANKILERKSSEVEIGKRELELHLSELEQENVQLSTRVTGLEAQLRYLTDEKETSRLELENSWSLAVSLRDEIPRLRTEMETQKADLKQKLYDVQNRWSDAQDECEYLRRENSQLQATAESLTEECRFLQNSNGELRKQKLELHEHCTDLEVKLTESHNSFADCSRRVDDLEHNLSSMLEDIASKERSMALELDALLDEDRKHKEMAILGESLLNQMYLKKTVEVENLKQEVERLTETISATRDEKERMSSDDVHEVSSLRADKARLESALQEVQATVKQTENKLYTDRIESDMKVEDLKDELTTSKQNQEMLMADHEKLLKLLDSCKTSEEKFKTIANGLELKLTVSEYERQQLLEDTTHLKFQLQKIAHLQDEVLTLMNKLHATKSEKDKMEASLQLLSGECEDLKAEKVSYIDKISALQKDVSELDDCKRNRVALEEKLLRMKGDLVAKDALCAQDAELKNELIRIKSANRQLQRKIQQLEDEKDECMMRTRTLEEELKFIKVEKQNQKESSSIKTPSFSKTNAKVIPVHEDMKLSKGDNGSEFHGGSPRAPDPMSKIQSLEKELAEAVEARNTYKLQVKRLSSKHRNSNVDVGVLTRERFDRTKSSLEAELKDIRERYLHMSLQYAEAEAQREELVMKLKAAKSGKRWF